MRVFIAVLTFLSMLAHALPAFAQTVTETEPNDSPATASTALLGGTVTGKVGQTLPDTADYWVVYASAGDTIHVAVDACSSCARGRVGIRLLAADGVTTLVGGRGWNGADPQLAFVARSSGPYFLRVTYNSDHGDPPRLYTLSLVERKCPDDSNEPDSSITTAPIIGTEFDMASRWCPTGDVDLYGVPVTEGTVLEFWVDSVVTNWYESPKVILWDQHGQILMQERFWEDHTRHLLYQVPADGTVYVQPATWWGGLQERYRLHVRSHRAPPAGLTVVRAARELTRPGTVLNDDERSYLDRIGNKNGAYDVGDFRSFFQLGGLERRPQ